MEACTLREVSKDREGGEPVGDFTGWGKSGRLEKSAVCFSRIQPASKCGDTSRRGEMMRKGRNELGG